MKIPLKFALLWLFIGCSKNVWGSALGIHPLSPSALARDDISQVEYWDKYYHRPKRTIEPILGSAGAIIQLKQSLISGSKRKIIEIAQNSAAALGRTSASASNQLTAALLAETQRKIGNIFTASTGAIGSASSGLNSVKHAAVSGVVGAIGSASHKLKSAAVNTAKQALSASSASSSAIHTIKSNIVSGITKNVAQLARGSVGAIASGSQSKINKITNLSSHVAPSGLQSKLHQVSKDIAVGGADVANHLQTAIVAGTHQKLGKAASGLAGAIAGAVGSASAGLGQITRGVVSETLNAANKAKSAIVEHTQRKFSQTIQGVVGASQASSSGLHQVKSTLSKKATDGLGNIIQGTLSASSNVGHGLVGHIGHASGGIHETAKQIKSAAFTHLTSSIGQLLRSSASASSGANLALHQLKGAALNHLTSQIGQIARQAFSASSSASSGANQLVHQLKTAAASHLVNKVGQIARGATSASSQASSGLVQTAGQLQSAAASHLTNKISKIARGSLSTITGASTSLAQGVHQLKSAATAHLTNTLGQVARGSAGASANVKQLKSLALSHLTNQLGQASKASATASLRGINQVKSAAVSHVTNKLKQVAQSSAGASQASNQLKSGLVEGIQHRISDLAETSAGRRKRSVKDHLKTTLVSSVAAASGGLSHVIGKAAAGSASAIAGASNTHHLKTVAFKHTANSLRKVVSASSLLSSFNPLKSLATASAGRVTKLGLVHLLKSSAISHFASNIGNIALSSASLASGSKPVVHQQESTTTKVTSTTTKIDEMEEETTESATRRKRSSWNHEDLPKRSGSPWESTGSGSIFTELKSAVVSGLKQKIGQVAQGSAGALAGASAGFSKGSSGSQKESYHHGYSYDDHHEVIHEHKGYDTWDLKKSVFNTLLQAVKAIKGGVLAIKGQLIKGSGFVVAGGGKLLQASGDKVTQLGKNVLSTAVLVHPHKEHHVHPVSDHVYHTGPAVVYDAPPSGHGYESHYESPYDHHHDKVHGSPAGLVILRKAPSTHDKYHSSASYSIPAFKPVPPGPTFGTVVGKFFTAATSLNPSEPTPFSHEDFHPYENINHNPAPVVFQSPVNNHISPSDDSDYRSPITYSDHLVAESSRSNEQKLQLTKGEILDHIQGSPTLATSQVILPENSPDSLQPLKQASHLEPLFNSDYLPDLKPPNVRTLANSLEYYKRTKKTADDNSLQQSEEDSRQISSKEEYMKFIEKFPYYITPLPTPNYKSMSAKSYLVQKMKSLRNKPDYSVVKSVAYEITENGAKRLT